MNVEKLPSGSYRIRQMYNGKRFSFTLDHKPTQKEILEIIANNFDQIRTGGDKCTFEDAAQKYIDAKRNVLSPRSILEYSRIAKRLSPWFTGLTLSEITQADINKQVNELALDKSPKTVACMHGFITAVLGVYRPDFKVNTRLPQRIKKEPYIPSDDDVKKILQHVKGSQFEVPIILACYGMRRSEICALTVDDIDGDVVHINKALVQNDKKEWVVKTTKTTSSTRDIVIPMEVADLIREQGYVYKGFPGSISNHLKRVQKELGIEQFSIHKLRHYFASKLSAMNIPDAEIMKLGGWETDHVMKTVYRHSMMAKQKDFQRETADKLRRTLFE